MENFLKLNKHELLIKKNELLKEYTSFKNTGIRLDISRGKPSKEQIDLSIKLLDCIDSKSEYKSQDGIDCRNYGLPCGLPEAKRLLAPLMGVNEDDIIVGGNSSLHLMFDAISLFMTHGISGYKPWARQGKIKFLCPSPGYDRHFKISEYFGMELVPIKMTNTGPDMNTIEKLVQSDPLIKGIWCVPKYSNPQGITYSDETVKRFATLHPASGDFRIFWDNAYSVHDLTNQSTELLNIMNECKKVNSEELPIIFCSTSKITFAGSGISAMACRGSNLDALKKQFTIKSVGPDKLNQLRHVRFLKDIDGIHSHMKRHREILAPKFKLILDKFNLNFSDNPIIKWDKPKGGYFISVYTIDGCAKRIVRLCKEAGLILTEAGATYPYGIDPNDNNIRIAPSFPSLDILEKAISLFCIVTKIVSIEKIVENLNN